MVELHTLGDAVIRVGEREVRPTSPAVFAALLYLCVERGHRVPRAALQELLFPDVDERSGAHSLRQLLYKLRRLGVPLEADYEAILLPANEVTVDATAPLDLNDSATLRNISREPLTAYAPRLGGTFERWLEGYRARLILHIRRQLLTALEQARHGLQWELVDDLACAILANDALNEEATLALAESRAMTGAKTAAIALLERYSHETGRTDLHLSAAVLRRRISERLDNGGPGDVRFVGRQADTRAIVDELLDRSLAPKRLAVIAGEAGIGKTRLLSETLRLAALNGAAVETVTCRRNYATRPFSIFIDLIPALLNCEGALGIAPDSLRHLRYFTGQRDEEAPHLREARDESARTSVLLMAVRDLVNAIRAETPLIVAVDDLQWADTESLNELAELSRRGLSVVVTTRHLSMLRSVIDLDKQALVRTLAPLDATSAGALASQLLPSHPSHETVNWITSTSGGNPFFITMLCSHYEATKQAFTVPPTLVAATRTRVEQLQPSARRVLEICALLGRHATLADLGSVLGRPRQDLICDVESLEVNGFLQLRDDAPAVVHDLLADCTLSALPPLTLRLLHSCVAANLEHRYESNPDSTLLWDCADHWIASGETDRGLTFLVRCARHAIDLGKAPYASTILERARSIALSPKDSATILAESMVAARSAGEWQRVFDFARLRRSSGSVPEVALHDDAELIEIEAHWHVENSGAAQEQTLLRCATSSDATKEHRIDAASTLLKIAHDLAHHAIAKKAFDAVAPLLDATSTRYSERAVPLLYHASFGSVQEALSLGERLAADADQLTGVTSRIRAIVTVATLFGLLGKYDEVFSIAQRGLEIAEKMGVAGLQAHFTCIACSAKVMAREFEAAEEWYCRSLSLPELSGNPTMPQRANAIELAIWQRNLERAEALCEEGLRAVVESQRYRGYLFGALARARLTDSAYVPPANEVACLAEYFEATKRLSCVDGLAFAYVESLRRSGAQELASTTLASYLTLERRETAAVPDDLLDLKATLRRQS